MDGPDSSRHEQIAQTGFPFQIAVANQIRDSQSEHGWKVLAPEVPWAHGFIDIVIARYEGPVVAIECKRAVLKAGPPQQWIFTSSNGECGETSDVRVEMIFLAGVHRASASPEELERRISSVKARFEPSGPCADFCAYPKTGGPSGSFEKVAGELVASAHDLLRQPKWLPPGDPEAPLAIYPIVVTNAELYVCTFDGGSSILTTGNPNTSRYERRPVVRFQKSLVNYDTRHHIDKALPLDLWVRERERTIIVVEASELTTFLRSFAARSQLPDAGVM